MSRMTLTKFTHACVRVERDGAVLVIDPGMFGERTAADDADAVLITHAHRDHLAVEALTAAVAARPDLVVYAHPDVHPELAELAATVRPAVPGEELTVAGFRVRVCGGRHAVIHPDIPRVANVGYLIEDAVYHPGDSVDPADLPDGVAVETLFLPVHAPWLKLAETIDYARAVAPRRAIALHDHLLTETAAGLYDAHLTRLAGCEYRRLTPGSAV